MNDYSNPYEVHWYWNPMMIVFFAGIVYAGGLWMSWTLGQARGMSLGAKETRQVDVADVKQWIRYSEQLQRELEATRDGCALVIRGEK